MGRPKGRFTAAKTFTLDIMTLEWLHRECLEQKIKASALHCRLRPGTGIISMANFPSMIISISTGMISPQYFFLNKSACPFISSLDIKGALNSL